MSDGARADHERPAAPQRVLGFALAPQAVRRRHRDGPEPQRVLGFPTARLEDPEATWLEAIAHPLRSLRAFSRRRLER